MFLQSFALSVTLRSLPKQPAQNYLKWIFLHTISSEMMKNFWQHGKTWQCQHQSEYFFSTLLKVNPTKLIRQPIKYESPTNDINDSINDKLDRKSCYIPEEKKVKKSSFSITWFPTMYINGNQKTPLHVMAASSIYDKCRSRELITTLRIQ